MLYLLVVEKEAIFHRLVEDGFTRSASCILIACCGYPDVAVRAAVSRIANFFPVCQPRLLVFISFDRRRRLLSLCSANIAVFLFQTITCVGLSDYNPHGFALMQCFR